MLDLEHQSELEERQEQPEGSADATRSRANSESDSIQTNCSAGKTITFVDAGSDVLLSKYLVAKTATDAEGTERKG